MTEADNEPAVRSRQETRDIPPPCCSKTLPAFKARQHHLNGLENPVPALRHALLGKCEKHPGGTFRVDLEPYLRRGDEGADVTESTSPESEAFEVSYDLDSLVVVSEKLPILGKFQYNPIPNFKSQFKSRNHIKVRGLPALPERGLQKDDATTLFPLHRLPNFHFGTMESDVHVHMFFPMMRSPQTPTRSKAASDAEDTECSEGSDEECSDDEDPKVEEDDEEPNAEEDDEAKSEDDAVEDGPADDGEDGRDDEAADDDDADTDAPTETTAATGTPRRENERKGSMNGMCFPRAVIFYDELMRPALAKVLKTFADHSYPSLKAMQLCSTSMHGRLGRPQITIRGEDLNRALRIVREEIQRAQREMPPGEQHPWSIFDHFFFMTTLWNQKLLYSSLHCDPFSVVTRVLDLTNIPDTHIFVDAGVDIRLRETTPAAPPHVLLWPRRTAERMQRVLQAKGQLNGWAETHDVATVTCPPAVSLVRDTGALKVIIYHNSKAADYTTHARGTSAGLGSFTVTDTVAGNNMYMKCRDGLLHAWASGARVSYGCRWEVRCQWAAFNARGGVRDRMGELARRMLHSSDFYVVPSAVAFGHRAVRLAAYDRGLVAARSRVVERAANRLTRTMTREVTGVAHPPTEDADIAPGAAEATAEAHRRDVAASIGVKRMFAWLHACLYGLLHRRLILSQLYYFVRAARVPTRQLRYNQPFLAAEDVDLIDMAILETLEPRLGLTELSRRHFEPALCILKQVLQHQRLRDRPAHVAHGVGLPRTYLQLTRRHVDTATIQAALPAMAHELIQCFQRTIWTMLPNPRSNLFSMDARDAAYMGDTVPFTVQHVLNHVRRRWVMEFPTDQLWQRVFQSYFTHHRTLLHRAMEASVRLSGKGPNPGRQQPAPPTKALPKFGVIWSKSKMVYLEEYLNLTMRMTEAQADELDVLLQAAMKQHIEVLPFPKAGGIWEYARGPLRRYEGSYLRWVIQPRYARELPIFDNSGIDLWVARSGVTIGRELCRPLPCRRADDQPRPLASQYGVDADTAALSRNTATTGPRPAVPAAAAATAAAAPRPAAAAAATPERRRSLRNAPEPPPPDPMEVYYAEDPVCPAAAPAPADALALAPPALAPALAPAPALALPPPALAPAPAAAAALAPPALAPAPAPALAPPALAPAPAPALAPPALAPAPAPALAPPALAPAPAPAPAPALAPAAAAAAAAALALAPPAPPLPPAPTQPAVQPAPQPRGILRARDEGDEHALGPPRQRQRIHFAPQPVVFYYTPPVFFYTPPPEPPRRGRGGGKTRNTAPRQVDGRFGNSR